MDKAHILAEIQRTATANCGKALGKLRFENETGIKPQDWYGKYWARWGDALCEAGFQPNSMQDAYNLEYLMEQLVVFIRELGRFPTDGANQGQPSLLTILGAFAPLRETLPMVAKKSR